MKDEVAGDGALGDADGGTGGAAEDDGGGDVAYGGMGDLGGPGVEVVTVDVDGASWHGGDWGDPVEMWGVGLVGSEEGAERGHGLMASVDGCEGKRNLGLEAEVDEYEDGKSEEAGGHVVEHDAGAFGELFEEADGPGLEDIEEAEEEEGQDGVGPVGGAEDKGDELARYLVDDDVAGIFATGFAGYDGGRGDAYERGEDCCD